MSEKEDFRLFVHPFPVRQTVELKFKLESG